MKEFTIGETVRVVTLPPYLKTAEPMPMLRPPSVIAIGEKGVVVARNPGDYWTVRFDGGTFFLEGKYMESMTGSSNSEESSGS